MKRTARDAWAPVLPADLWCHVMPFVPEVSVLLKLVQCSRGLWQFSRALSLAPWAISDLDRWWVANVPTAQWAALLHQCQLCPRKLQNARPNLWDWYSHEECLSRAVIHLHDCVRKFDLSCEAVQAACGSVQLHRVRLDRVAQLVQQLHGQTLEQRAGAVAVQRALRQTGADQDQQRQQTLLDQWNVERQRDRECYFGRFREVRSKRLEPLLVIHAVPAIMAEWVRRLVYDTEVLPLPWTRLEEQMREWGPLWVKWREVVPDGVAVRLVASKDWMSRQGRLLLRPTVLRERLEGVQRWLQGVASEDVQRYIQAFDQTS